MEHSGKNWYKKWWGILIIIFLAIILFFLAASAFYFIGEIKNARLKLSQSGPELSGEQYPAATDNSYWLGSTGAKITIVEFGDFACPHCLSAYPTVRELSLRYKDDIKFIWRDYPVVADYSATLALAGRCAGEQNLFWLMYDKLLQNQGVSSADQLLALANQIGADLTKFQNCLSQRKYLPQIQKDLADGQAFGITGTPTYFINGYKLAGDVPLDVFIQIIEQLKE